MYDCPGKEDEEGCTSCPGLYRCLSSKVCLLDTHLCDGMFHCPHRDDELFCNLTCPENCTCQGLSFTCMGGFLGDMHNYTHLRFLKVDSGGGGDGMVEEKLQENTLLIHLSVAGGRLTRFNVSLPNLNSLDLSDNKIVCLCHVDFAGLKSLRVLVLHDNPLISPVVHLPSSASAGPSLSVLDLSNSRIPLLSLRHFRVFPNLHLLNLSGSSTQRITGAVTQSPGGLRVLDLRGCPVSEFSPGVFRGLHQLHTLYGSTYKLCCSDLHSQGFSLLNCLAPSDSLSDCQRLLKDDMHIAFTAIAAAMAVIGNAASCVARVVRRRARDAAFRTLMMHLCVSDGMMGIYLAVVSLAAREFQGGYLWQDIAWRRSALCQLSAFLSVLSSQVSAAIVSLVTLDSVRAHTEWMAKVGFRPRSAYMLCAASWLTGAALAALTSLPVTSLRRAGSDHALCTPLLFSELTAIGPVMSSIIIFDGVLHVLIAAGEIYIFFPSLYRSRALKAVTESDTSADTVETLSLAYIGTSKALCWFIASLPVIVYISKDTWPKDLPVNMAVFVLPLNAALNPLLSVLAEVMAQRQHAHKARLMKILAAKLAAKSA